MPPLLGLAPGFVTASTLTCPLAPGFLSLPMRLVPALRVLPGAPLLDRDLRLLIGPREGGLPLHPPLLQRQRLLGDRREGFPQGLVELVVSIVRPHLRQRLEDDGILVLVLVPLIVLAHPVLLVAAPRAGFESRVLPPTTSRPEESLTHRFPGTSPR